MARNKTFPEKLLWAKLRDKQLGVNFHAQRIIYGYIVDFWCPSAGLVVEVDGAHHRAQASYDAHRDAVMRCKGISVLRVTAQQVVNNRAAVVALIRQRIARRMR